MLRRFVGVIRNRDHAAPPTVFKKAQYIVVGHDFESRFGDFVAAVTFLIWVIVTVVLFFKVVSNYTTVCYGCEACTVPENECGSLISTQSGDAFCTASSLYLRPKIAFYSSKTTLEPVENLCSGVCNIHFSENIRINYTNPKSGHSTFVTLGHSDSICLQRLILFRSHLFNCKSFCWSG